MLARLQTRGYLGRAHKLRRQINKLEDPISATRDAAKLSAQIVSAKNIFLNAMQKGKADELAPLYGEIARKKGAKPGKSKARVKSRLPVETAQECMMVLKTLINRAGARAFLVSGTLLGCVRENRILAHDYDIDLGIDIADPGFRALTTALGSHPDFRLRGADIDLVTNEIALLNDWARPHAGKQWLAKYVYKDAIPVDLFTHISHAGEVFHGSKRNLWCNSDFELGTVSLYGVDFLAPTDVDRYLTENYGDWRTPMVDFECTTDTPNSRVIHSLAAAKFLMKRIVMFGWRDDLRRQRIVLDRLHQCFA